MTNVAFVNGRGSPTLDGPWDVSPDDSDLRVRYHVLVPARVAILLLCFA